MTISNTAENTSNKKTRKKLLNFAKWVAGEFKLMAEAKWLRQVRSM